MDALARELALFRVEMASGQRAAVIEIGLAFRATVLHADGLGIVLQAVGVPEEIDALLELFGDLAPTRCIRTAPISLDEG